MQGVERGLRVHDSINKPGKSTEQFRHDTKLRCFDPVLAPAVLSGIPSFEAQIPDGMLREWERSKAEGHLVNDGFDLIAFGRNVLPGQFDKL